MAVSPNDPDLMTREEDISRASRSLKAMSHPLRLKILCTLGDQEVSVQDIVEAVGTSQSNISQHLAILRDKGILAFGNVNDMNKEENGKDVVVVSALWHMENAINNAISLVKAGNFKAEDYKEWTMMQKGGASLSPYYEFDDRIPAEAKAKVAALQADIMSGKYVVEINDNEPKSSY